MGGRKKKRYTWQVTGKPEDIIRLRIAWRAFYEYMQLAGKNPLKELARYMQQQVKQIAAVLHQENQEQQ